MNVLAIGCHPDDIEISWCGTLAKCVDRGDRVVVCHVANGNMGHEIIKPDELRLIRREEARRAGALAGIEVVTTDVGDLLPNGCSVEQRDKIADLIRNSGSHWSYIGSSEYSYIGVGVEYREGTEFGWYACVMVGSVNYG